jgi:aspartate 1-decarboxylase
MQNRTMLRAKVHRITVTMRDLEYEGSLTLDPVLMEAADMVPYERIEVYDVENGNRFATYLITGERGAGECCVNGAAAHMVNVGDKLILATYLTVTDDELADYRPRIVMVGEGNTIKSVGDAEHAGVRVAG